MAQIQILRSGKIKSIRWAVGPTATTSNGVACLELSIQPTSSVLDNNSVNSIDSIVLSSVNVTTATQAQYGATVSNEQHLVDFAVTERQVLYINSTALSGTLGVEGNVFVDIQE